MGKKIIINALQDIIDRLQQSGNGYENNDSLTSQSVSIGWIMDSPLTEKVKSLINHKDFINHVIVAAIFIWAFYFLLVQQFG